MASIRPSTSFHIRNEQVRLSLLANQDDIRYADDSSSRGSQDRESGVDVSGPKFVISSPWESSVHPPPSIPPQEIPLIFALSSIFDFLVSLILVALFLVGFAVFLAIFLILGVILRLVVKIILSCMTPTLLPISRVFGSTNENQHNTVLLVLKGHCDIHKIRRSFMNVINTGKYYKLRSKLLTRRMGYLCVDNCTVRFDIKNHINYLDIGRDTPFMKESDMIQYLEKHHLKLFPGEGKLPQWEVLVIPSYRPSGKRVGMDPSYALILRFHNGIMDWSMIREFITENVGRTGGRVFTPFQPISPQSICLSLKIFLAFFFSGPAAFMRKLLWGKPADKFLPLKRASIGDLSVGFSKPIPCFNWEEIQEETQTGEHCALSSCIRISARNLFLSQAMKIPGSLNVTRVFGPGEVDTFSTNYDEYRRIIDRLHVTYHAVDRKKVDLSAQQLFNKFLILMASTMPFKMARCLHEIITRGDVMVHYWPGKNLSCKLFGGDQVTDMWGIAGTNGGNSDFTITISTYMEHMRASVVGLVGELSSGVTGAQTMANEMDEEYVHQATAVGIREYNLFREYE